MALTVGTQEEPPAGGARPAPGASAPRPQAVEPSARYNASQPKHVDRRTVTDLAVGAMDLAKLGLQDDGADGFAPRALKWGLSFWLGIACTHVVHEYGHISSMSRCGCNSAKLGEVGEPLDEREDATLGRLFLQGLVPSSPGRALSLSDGDWEDLQARFQGNPEGYARFWLTVETGGLNQEQVMASRYATRLHEDRLSYLDSPSFLWAAGGTILYPAAVVESDIADYVALLDAQGRSTTATRLKLLSALRYVGGTGLASLRGAAVGLLGTEGGFVEPLVTEPIDGLRVFWPELESYLTLSGPTLKISLPLRPGVFTLLPSYERSFASGGADHEAGLRARAPLFDGLLAFEGGLYAGDRGGSWRSVETELRPLPWASVLLGLEGGTGATFMREIFGARDEIVEGSEKSLFVGLRLSLLF